GKHEPDGEPMFPCCHDIRCSAETRGKGLLQVAFGTCINTQLLKRPSERGLLQRLYRPISVFRLGRTENKNTENFVAIMRRERSSVVGFPRNIDALSGKARAIRTGLHHESLFSKKLQRPLTPRAR